jgi:hypothetical protein
MKPQPEIDDTQLYREENNFAELERQKSITRLKIIADWAMPFTLFSLRVRWKLSKKTLCMTSNEPKALVVDEKSYRESRPTQKRSVGCDLHPTRSPIGKRWSVRLGGPR